jgi:hypothetical protein
MRQLILATGLVGLLVAAPMAQTKAPAVKASAVNEPLVADRGDAGKSSGAGAVGATGTEVAAVGWVYRHATNCHHVWDGTWDWLYVYPSEGGYIATAVAADQILLAPACTAGNFFAYYVDNVGFNGHWNDLFTYTYK